MTVRASRWRAPGLARAASVARIAVLVTPFLSLLSVRCLPSRTRFKLDVDGEEGHASRDFALAELRAMKKRLDVLCMRL